MPQNEPAHALSFEDVPTCPVCKAAGAEKAFSKMDEYFGLSFDIQKCAACTAYFVGPRVARKHLPELYAGDYFNGDSWDSDTDYMSNYARPERLSELKRMYLRYYDQIRAKTGVAAPRILDAGAGLGLFSQTVKEAHPEADIVSLDPSAYAVSHMKNLGLNAVHSELESYQADQPFDAVFMREVLEHLYDPVIAVRNIAAQLRPGGVFFYTTGNTDHVKDLTQWGYVRPVGHIVYYNPESARALLTACGLKPYPREFLRTGLRNKLSGGFKWAKAALGLSSGELPVGIR